MQNLVATFLNRQTGIAGRLHGCRVHLDTLHTPTQLLSQHQGSSGPTAHVHQAAGAHKSQLLPSERKRNASSSASHRRLEHRRQMKAGFDVPTETCRETLVFPSKLQAFDPGAATRPCMGVISGIGAPDGRLRWARIQIQRLASGALPISPASRGTLKCPILDSVVHECSVSGTTYWTCVDFFQIGSIPVRLHTRIATVRKRAGGDLIHPQTPSAWVAPRSRMTQEPAQSARPLGRRQMWCLERDDGPRCLTGNGRGIRYRRPSTT